MNVPYEVKRLKYINFKNKSEDFIREEFVIPLFNSVGYFAQNFCNIIRGKKLSIPKLKNLKKRYKFPDLCLACDEKIIWVIESKSSKVDINKKDFKKQVFEYCRHPEVNCSNAIITNAINTNLYRAKSNNELILLKSFKLSDLFNSQGWELFHNFINPLNTLNNIYTFNELINLYRDAPYNYRAILMNAIQVRKNESLEFLKNNFNKLLKSNNCKDRSLPTIIAFFNWKNLPKIIDRLYLENLKDTHDAVRDTILTCIRNQLVRDPEFMAPNDILDMRSGTWFGDQIYSQILGSIIKYKKYTSAEMEAGVEKMLSSLQKNKNIHVKKSATFASKGLLYPFTFGVLLSKPKFGPDFDDYIYSESLKVTIDMISDFTYRDESRKAGIDTLITLKKTNPNILEIYLSDLAKSQRRILKKVIERNVFS